MSAFDFFGNSHDCQDELATSAGGRHICQCPGGPYFISIEAANNAWNESTRAWERQREQDIQDGFRSPAEMEAFQADQRRLRQNRY